MNAASGGGSSMREIVTPEVQSKITGKLQEIFGDDDVSVLTDYICHMVNHNQPKEHIINELKEFLSDEATQFGTWVFQLVEGSKTSCFSGSSATADTKAKSHSTDSGSTKGNLTTSESKKSSGSQNQNRDSLDFAISNAIRSKPSSGKSKHSHLSSSSSYRDCYSNLNMESSSGPLGGPGRFPRVNYRNSPYTKSSIYGQSSLGFPSSIQIGGPPLGISSTHGKIKVRCKNWPNCDKGDHCFYIHPCEACKSWPLCPYGPACFFIHPSVPCRYGLACYNTLCNYTHPIGWDPNHVEVPVFKYGGYRNSSLIISNSKPPATGNANPNGSESSVITASHNAAPTYIDLNHDASRIVTFDSSNGSGNSNVEHEKNMTFFNNQ
ncbi:putative nuclear polyadenylated RNA-binding protein NAB2 [Cryptosporidium felis]|nr:putative nuclear polyadenylated RNA-binding protein NAB2 [Cryptosporidium felis]